MKKLCESLKEHATKKQLVLKKNVALHKQIAKITRRHESVLHLCKIFHKKTL